MTSRLRMTLMLGGLYISRKVCLCVEVGALPPRRAGPRRRGDSVLVPVAVVGGVAVPVVRVVHVVAVGHRLVAAALSVVVVGVRDVDVVVALVPMTVVGPVDVPVVEVVGVVAVVGGDMTAPLPMVMVVLGVGGMVGGRHRSVPLVGMDDGIADDVADVIVGQRVDDLPAPASTAHDVLGAQDPEVLGDQWLGDVQGFNQLVHAVLARLECQDDREAVLAGQSSQQRRRRRQRVLVGEYGR